MLKLQNSTTFLRIYVSILGALSVLNVYLPPVTGISYFKSLSLFALLCVPVTIIIMVILEQFSSTVTNVLCGLGTKEDQTAAICDNEIMKVITLKESKEYDKLLSELVTIEKEHGTSSRIIYERAHCLMELGELRKARRCIKDYLSTTQSNKHDTYHQFCLQLITNKKAPLTLENINAVSR